MQGRTGLFGRVLVGFMLSSSVVACGSTKDNTDELEGTVDGGTTGDGSATGDGSGGDGADDTPFTLGCNPACGDTQFCSTTKVCIDKGSCLADGDCAAGGMKCDTATKTCVPGGGCGAIEAKADLVPPNMLIVLDRSCSMRTAISGTPKWTHAVNAIKTLTTNYAGKIRFGLTMFPDTAGTDCAQGAIPVLPGAMKETQIQTLLSKALVTTDVNYPDGPCVTNIDTGIKQAQDCAELKDMTRGNFVLLISDGAQAGCNAAGGDVGTENMITAMAATGVKTAVVGFGAGADPAQLDKFAVAGLMPSAGATKFYKAEDAASLDAALASIAAASLGCTYKLDAPPADATKIYVFFENVTEVPRDKTNGWEYDPATNSVVFYGTSCTDLKAGKIKDVDIVLGCKQPTPT